MNKLSITGKLAIAAAVGLVIGIVLAAVYFGASAPIPQPPTGTATSGSQPGTQSGAGGTTGSASGPAASKTSGSKGLTVIKLVTPVPGAVWTIATPNIISWAKEGGFSGQIELLDASTMKLVGVILPQTGPSQTYYEWNTRDISLSRTNPAKTTVLPGKYVIKILFDGNNVAPITSQPFTISK